MWWSGRLACLLIFCAPGLPALAAELVDPAGAKEAPTAFNQEAPEPVLAWGKGEGRSYWVPALDIVAFDVLLNRFNHAFIDPDDYGISATSIRNNLRGKWVYDSDPFAVNQFLHPYQGNMYHGFARSAGLGYWESLGYTMLGSAFWEVAGETTPPSINDQITTGFAGSFFGESMFRMASLLLESGEGQPGFWRELGAAVISPSTGFNRYAYGRRFDGVFRSGDPAVYTRLQLGLNLNAHVRSNVNLNPVLGEASIPQEFQRGEATLGFTMDYGLPGKRGYQYRRPFDYFHFEFNAVTSNVLESVMSYGLLYGTDYAAGENMRGIWGLYGSYDYIAPQIFRVSTTALALGTNTQWWLGPGLALQGTALGGVGYGSAGIIDGRGERDYHNGLTPQALLSLRLIAGDRAALELTGRDYYVSDVASDEKGGTENIARVDLGLTWRVHNLHGITLKYAFSHRAADYRQLDDTRQSVSSVSLGYTYLGHRWFGAVDWRPGAENK